MPVAIDAIATGDAGIAARDTEFTIPNDWDLFWENIRSDMFDVIPVDPNGNQLTFSRKSGANYSTRTLTIEVDGYATKGQSIVKIYLYFQNPDQSSDLSTSTTMTNVLTGYIELARASQLVASQALLRPATTTPQTSFVKASVDEIDIYFFVGNFFGDRSTKYNGRLLYEDINYVNILSLDSSSTNDTNRYDENQTRFVEGHIRVRAKGGSNGTDYALVCRLVTTETQQIDIRTLIQTRDPLPS